MSQRRFEQSLGMKEWSLKGLFDKAAPRVPSIDNAAEIAAALGLELYLGPRRETRPTPPANPKEFVRVPLHGAWLSAGSGADNFSEEVIDHLAFRRDWLRSLNIAPDAAVIARARGNSMLPLIHDGDMILIDSGRAEPPTKPRDPADKRPAKVYALLDDNLAKVKRLELAAPDILAILSDNPDYPPKFRPLSAVTIIGRVMWWGHTNRE